MGLVGWLVAYVDRWVTTSTLHTYLMIASAVAVVAATSCCLGYLYFFFCLLFRWRRTIGEVTELHLSRLLTTLSYRALSNQGVLKAKKLQEKGYHKETQKQRGKKMATPVASHIDIKPDRTEFPNAKSQSESTPPHTPRDDVRSPLSGSRPSSLPHLRLPFRFLISLLLSLISSSPSPTSRSCK